MTLSLRLLPALIATALCTAATAAAAASPTTWVSTHTRAHDVFSAETGDALAAAEEVAPGHALHVVVTLQLRNRDALDQRVARIKAGSRTDFINSAQAAMLHLPTQAQVDAVVKHLNDAGFRNITVASNRLLVSADGSAANAHAAFNTTLHHFGSGENRVFANTTDAQVPAALGGIVMSVHGLHDAAAFHTMSHVYTPSAVTPAATVAGHSPTDFPLIYNASSMAAASTATLAIISEGNLDPTLADLTAFTTKVGYAPVNATVTYVGTRGTDTSGTIEWDLDSQDALAAAGGALKQMIFYAATSLQDAPITAAYNQAVADNKASVVNISLGECETAAKNSGVEASNDQIFALGVAQGQTFSVSSGDSGSKECGRRRGNKQSYPAVSPYVMALGGTTLSTNGTVWAGETVWSGTGGGPSVTEPAPVWQKNSGVLGTSNFRGVPDIAFDADPASGAIIIVNGKNTQVGGTSLSAPLFAGFWARIQHANGNALVSPDPALYANAAANPSLFHDVVSGSNGGFSATAGWDYTTGWGSLNVSAFAAFVATHPGF